MSSIIFLYRGEEVLIQCEIKEKLESIVQRFCSKVQASKENMNFICNGNILDEQMTEDKIPFNQNNKRFICVDENIQINNSKDIVIKSNVIICPQCQECASISFNNYKILISNCKNGHNLNNIKINDFSNTQNINLSKIICEQCKRNNMGIAVNNIFFKCIECKKNLCSLCKFAHNPQHNIFLYSNKYYLCEEHGESLISYCYDCKQNLCFLCEEKHNNHNTKYFNQMDNYDDKNKLNEQLIKFRENINNLKEKINNIINICNKVVDNYEIVYNIKKDIYNNINRKFRNIQKLENQKFINNIIDDDLQSIIK